MIIIAFSYAYMVPKYPKTGGEFTFTKMCFGRNMAYVCGWFLVGAYLTNVPMNSTAIGLIVDGLDGSADILKWGLHYQVAGYDVWLGEMLLAMGILILFGILNILGVKKAGIVQTILAALLGISVVTLTIAALASSKTSLANMDPWWGGVISLMPLLHGQMEIIHRLTSSLTVEQLVRYQLYWRLLSLHLGHR